MVRDQTDDAAGARVRAGQRFGMNIQAGTRFRIWWTERGKIVTGGGEIRGLDLKNETPETRTRYPPSIPIVLFPLVDQRIELKPRADLEVRKVAGNPLEPPTTAYFRG